MIRRPIPVWLTVVLGILGVAILLSAYGRLSSQQTKKNADQKVIPGWSDFKEGAARMLRPQGGEESPRPSMLVTDVKATYWRLLLGLVVGVVMSILIGIAMGAYHWAESLLAPAIAFFAKIPPTAMLPIYFVLVGTDQKMFTAMVALGVFFSMAQAVYQAITNEVKDVLVDKAYTLGASDAEIIYEVIWKQVLPSVLDSIRLHVGPAMIFLLAAEMLVGGEGMGFRIRMESRVLNMSVVYIYLAILGITGLIADYLLLWIRQRLCPWATR
jgi:NitT/TauT family transport system permease protein